MHSKETNDKMKSKPTECEKIFANDMTDKGLIPQNIQTAHTTQYQKNPKNLILKMGRRSK